MSYHAIGGGIHEEAGQKKGRKIKKKKKKRIVGSREMQEMLNKNYAIDGDNPSVTLGQ